MTSITYVGMDVHSKNYTLCCYSIEKDEVFARTEVNADWREITKYLNRVNNQRGGQCEFVCGYEAGCLGYSLYHQLTKQGITCKILAPSTMATVPGKRVKTDKLDAERISKCLAYNTYSPVFVPTADDEAVKEYIRMRDDIAADLKRTKQQIIALCMRHGKTYEGKSSWTKMHLKWLETLQFEHPVLRETLTEYLIIYYQLAEKLEIYDMRINELAAQEIYKEKVGKLSCFYAIATHTALSLIVETGDFCRFKDAEHYASYLGLVPGEHSSGEKTQRTGITKAGNSHLRRLLTESAQHYGRGTVIKKSKALAARQKGNTPQVIAYADKANERLKRKYQRIALRSKANIAKTAIARELACFTWGMMTGNIS